MDKKIKQIAVVSLVALMATGCSSYRGASQGTSGGNYSDGSSTTGSSGYSTGGRGYGQVARTGQVSRRGGFGQSQRSSTAATTCAPCNAAPKKQTSYTYQPATKKAPIRRTQPARQAGQHSQQWYIDRWNRQQNSQRGTQRNTQQSNAGYGSNASNTTYYDYSSAGNTTPAPAVNTNVATSNKSIYTGSYQQKTYKPYQPTTYSGGSSATTNTTSTVGTSTSGNSTYVVKKGDTVFEIMRQTGVYWKDIISLNNLTPPYSISSGQTIRLK